MIPFVSGSTFGSDDAWSTYLWDDGGVLKLHVHCGQTTLTADQYIINYQVIQHEGCSVQRGNTLMDASTTAITDSLSAAVDVSRACLLFNFALAATPAPDIGAMLLSGRITGANQISISRDHTGAVAIDDIRWECIEFTAATCQEVLVSYAVAQGQDDATLTEVSSLSAAIAFASCNQRGGLGAYAADDIVGESWFTADLTSPTNLRTIRASTNETATAVFYVIDFGAGVTKTISDGGTGADALAQVAAALALADTGAGADGFTGQAAVALIDGGAGVDGLVSPMVTLHIADVGAAADAAVFIGALVQALDTGTGTDGLAVGVKIVLAEAGSGIDAAGSSILVQIADTGFGLDVATIAHWLATIADGGSGADRLSGVSVSVVLADAGAAADLIAQVLAAVSMTDAGVGADIATAVLFVAKGKVRVTFSTRVPAICVTGKTPKITIQ